MMHGGAMAFGANDKIHYSCSHRRRVVSGLRRAHGAYVRAI